MAEQNQSALSGLLWGGQGGVQGLLGNPLLHAGIGLLSASRDRRIDPYQMAAQGLLQSGQYQQQQQQSKMQRELYDLKKAEYEREAQLAQQQAAAREKVQGLLGSGDVQGAAQAALASGDPALTRFATGLLSPQEDRRPASVREFEYMQSLDPSQREAFESLQRGRDTPYYTPLQTSTGLYQFNNRTGEISPMQGGAGAPLLPIAIDPVAQGAVANAKAENTEIGKAKGQAKVELPGYIADAKYSSGLIDKALRHPGRETVTGMSGALDPRNYMRGTDAADFQALSQQLQGRTFLEAYESLKGGGHITEVEGKKAEQAIARLQTTQSDEEYAKSLRDLQQVIQRGIDRAEIKAGLDPSSRENPGALPPDAGRFTIEVVN